MAIGKHNLFIGKEDQMNVNFELLKAIRVKGLRQQDFARLVGDHPSFVSRVINGWWNLDEARKIRYARVLGCRREDLFEK